MEFLYWHYANVVSTKSCCRIILYLSLPNGALDILMPHTANTGMGSNLLQSNNMPGWMRMWFPCTCYSSTKKSSMNKILRQFSGIYVRTMTIVCWQIIRIKMYSKVVIQEISYSRSYRKSNLWWYGESCYAT